MIREGYDHLSMRRLADAVEYAASTLYGYFPDKKAILCAVLERTTGALLDALGQAAATPGPLTRLRMLGRAYIEFALQYPRHYEVLFLLRGQNVPVIETPAFTAAVTYFREAVEEGVKRGIFRRVDAEETAQAFWAACHGLCALLLTHGDRYVFQPPARLLENLLTLQLEGLRPQAFGITANVHPVREASPAEATADAAG
ncbi:MAG: TetR/AcrR family transcriptional regulator [Fimbriimonadaceae bacterium]|nr:TetR/AcrR family transcriptional regulator [Fimbriimonadaceae bacterium]